MDYFENNEKKQKKVTSLKNILIFAA